MKFKIQWQSKAAPPSLKRAREKPNGCQMKTSLCHHHLLKSLPAAELDVLHYPPIRVSQGRSTPPPPPNSSLWEARTVKPGDVAQSERRPDADDLPGGRILPPPPLYHLPPGGGTAKRGKRPPVAPLPPKVSNSRPNSPQAPHCRPRTQIWATTSVGSEQYGFTRLTAPRPWGI